jgi:hypothetical protein
MRTKLCSDRLRDQDGAIIIIVMMFVLVFLIVGVALFLLVRSSNSATALERKDVKAFNVAEAGVDAAMSELRSGWPRFEGDPSVAVDPTEFRSLYPNTAQFPDPSHGVFINAITYDNTSDNPTSVEGNREFWDSNGDDVMWIDSEADVDNDRHRILVLVKRLKMPVELPDVALVANTAGGNGQGLDVSVDPAYLGDIPEGGADVVYTGKGTFNKDVSPGANIEMITQASNPFWSYVSDALLGNLRIMAEGAQPSSLFNNDAEAASAYLCDPLTGPGSVVYLESTEEPIIIGGNTDMGTPNKPVILVIDTKNSGYAIDWRGTSAFYGVVIVVGNAELRGTNDIFGCVENKGGPGIKYNGDYIRRLNTLHTLSVAIVPNTWEEYTIPK